MENLQSKRIYFDVEDRPPPAYWSTETQSPISDTRNNENESSKQQIKTKIDPKEWLKAPEFVPRSKQLFNESYFYNQKTMGNQFPASNPVNQVILPNTMTRQQIPIPTHAQAQAAALAATIPTQFSPAHTVIDLPQPVMPPQTIVPLSIGQPPPYFMSNTGTGPPQAPAPAPAPAPPPLHVPPMIPFPIPAINQTALALREALDMVPPGYSANITHINCKLSLLHMFNLF
ncbi:unnamed protein product [Thelazia callipaeda]|uniref:Protein muscleblind n=1 Tax=Thelazia callipaeda TaxID=103827 RepID=A0A0N5CK13_THECL|nr:unnamed protein product [Thelazia callipaeda]